jgi:hypothetical protein
LFKWSDLTLCRICKLWGIVDDEATPWGHPRSVAESVDGKDRGGGGCTLGCTAIIPAFYFHLRKPSSIHMLGANPIYWDRLDLIEIQACGSNNRSYKRRMRWGDWIRNMNTDEGRPLARSEDKYRRVCWKLIYHHVYRARPLLTLPYKG